MSQKVDVMLNHEWTFHGNKIKMSLKWIIYPIDSFMIQSCFNFKPENESWTIFPGMDFNHSIWYGNEISFQIFEQKWYWMRIISI